MRLDDTMSVQQRPVFAIQPVTLGWLLAVLVIVVVVVLMLLSMIDLKLGAILIALALTRLV